MAQIYRLLLTHGLLALKFMTTYKRKYIRKETSYRQTEIKFKRPLHFPEICWTYGALCDTVDGRIWKIHFRSNPKWPTADQSVRVALVFDFHSHYRQLCHKIEAKFRTCLHRCKIMGGVGEMSKQDFKINVGPNFLYPFGSGLPWGLRIQHIFSEYFYGNKLVPSNSQSWEATLIKFGMEIWSVIGASSMGFRFKVIVLLRFEVTARQRSNLRQISHSSPLPL